MTRFDFTLTAFTPGEAARITGVDTTKQRDWRRRKLLPDFPGHARFDAFDLAEMWALNLLSERGVPLKEAKEIAPWLATGTLHRALLVRDAYEGDHDKIETGRWADKSPSMARRILRHHDRVPGKGRVIPARYFIWWADGTDRWDQSIDDAFVKASAAKATGPVLVIDTNRLGEKLVELAGRPLVHIEVSDDARD